ncbi:MAG: hypothetical protein ACRDYZ_11405 [Acidimicrobiales bacterium]
MQYRGRAQRLEDLEAGVLVILADTSAWLEYDRAPGATWTTAWSR